MYAVCHAEAATSLFFLCFTVVYNWKASNDPPLAARCRNLQLKWCYRAKWLALDLVALLFFFCTEPNIQVRLVYILVLPTLLVLASCSEESPRLYIMCFAGRAYRLFSTSAKGKGIYFRKYRTHAESRPWCCCLMLSLKCEETSVVTKHG